MSELKHTAFFGDGEHDFLLTPEMIVELERKTGTGIGALCSRLLARDFRHGDLIEVTLVHRVFSRGVAKAFADRLDTGATEAEALPPAPPIAPADADSIDQLLGDLELGDGETVVEEMGELDAGTEVAIVAVSAKPKAK